MTKQVYVTTNLSGQTYASREFLNEIKIATLEGDQEIRLNVEQAYHVAMEILKWHSEFIRATAKSKENFIMTSLPDTEDELRKLGYRDLGWANNWTKERNDECSALVEGKKCRAGRMDWRCCHLTICDEAKVFWKVDSGD